MSKQWVKLQDVLLFQEGPGVRNMQYTTDGVKLLNVANSTANVPSKPIQKDL